MPQGFPGKFILKFPVFIDDLAVHDRELYFTILKPGKIGKISFFYFAAPRNTGAAKQTEFSGRLEGYLPNRISKWHNMFLLGQG